MVGVAPQVADRDARVLGFVVHDLGELLAPLLGEQRHRHADRLARRRGFSPRSELRIALSTAWIIFFSNGTTPMVRASISVIFATWLIGVCAP
jgi:hypothetical protein